jgi:hypothetical protein
MKQVMSALDQAATSNPNVSGPSSTSFAACWNTYMTDFMGEFQGNLQDNVSNLLKIVTPVWKKLASGNQPGAAAVYKELVRKANNLATDIVINTKFIQ